MVLESTSKHCHPADIGVPDQVEEKNCKINASDESSKKDVECEKKRGFCEKRIGGKQAKLR